MVGRKSLISLLDFKYKRIYKGENGKRGGSKNKTGRNGADLFISVPVGTEVHDEAGRLLADVVEDGQTYKAARGGLGGRGNARFVSPTHRVPTEFDEGEKGEERSLQLELKLLAAIGIIGLPNVGKSTLLARLTRATPEVGNYPFTTLTPHLGVLFEGDQRIVLADIPGIIEGASGGKGLGITFLRHIERTGMLLWVLDLSSPDVLRDYKTLEHEMGLYKAELTERERIIVLSKIDLVTREEVDRWERFFRERDESVAAVSAASGLGMDELKDQIREKDGRGRLHG